VAALDRACRGCFYLLRELALQDRPGGPLLATFEAYLADPAHDSATALEAAYAVADPAQVRAAQARVVSKGLMPPGTYGPGGGIP
jgi:hypothetical protein